MTDWEASVLGEYVIIDGEKFEVPRPVVSLLLRIGYERRFGGLSEGGEVSRDTHGATGAGGQCDRPGRTSLAESDPERGEHTSASGIADWLGEDGLRMGADPERGE